MGSTGFTPQNSHSTLSSFRGVDQCFVGHMDAYRDIMKLNLPTECPGPSPSRLERLDYRHIPRPIHPLDLLVGMEIIRADGSPDQASEARFP